MTTNEYERDFETPLLNQRFPGRFDPRLLSNQEDAGDGFPGMQKALRNVMPYIPLEPSESIQAKIEFLDSQGGGGIYLRPGTHGLLDTFPLAISNVSNSIVIIGIGDESIIDPNGNVTCFNITNCSSIVLRNFKILCNDITDTTPVVIVNESNDNPVIIDNVTIDGTGNGEDAYGFDIDSDNVIVRNCRIKEIRWAFDIAGSNCRIEGNIITNLDSPDGVGAGGSSTDVKAINNTGSYNDIINNTINGITSGSGVADNSTSGVGGNGGYVYGIYTTGSYCRIEGNKSLNFTTGNGGGSAGSSGTGGDAGDIITIYNTGSYNNIENNKAVTHTAGDGGDASLNIGGLAGMSVGICNTGSYNDINNNIIKELRGGDGADGVAFAGGGTKGWERGKSCGVNIFEASYNNINNNIINNVKGADNDGAQAGYGTGGGGTRGVYNTGNYNNINDNILEDFDGGLTGERSWPSSGSGTGVKIIDSSDNIIKGNIIRGMASGEGKNPPTSRGIYEYGTLDYNIYINNNYRGETAYLVGQNNIEEHNLA